MQQPQVITIGPDGSLRGLVQKGKLDFRAFGSASIKRITEILWDEAQQRWCVHFLLGVYAGTRLTEAMAQPFGVVDALKALDGESSGRGAAVFYFPEYDNAVQAEVAFINAARLAGQGYLVGDAA